MTTPLRLAPDLALPLDAVTRTFGILAVRGAGKSNTAAVMAEEMFKAQLPFCVVDPVGSWYGLRSSADGQAPGLAVPIFGGKHGDVPLERGAGELLADLIVEKRLTCVLDLSRFDSEADKKVFLLAFARRLYLKNENPLHLFLEEADDYIPQSPMGDEKVLLRAWENIVRRGRARGIGLTLITQRSAAIAKMVLTQVETLFAMRTTGPQDIAAIEAWVKYHQVGKDVLSTLSSLEDGEAWVWSPHFLKTMSRHQIRRRETFDSGATPKNVRAKDTRPPATLADIDLASLQARMAATIEKAKADDPRELRKQIAELKKQLGSKAESTAAAVAKTVDKPVLTEADRQMLRSLDGRLSDTMDALAEKADRTLQDIADHAKATIDASLSAWANDVASLRAAFLKQCESTGVQTILDKLATVPGIRGQGSGLRAPDKSSSNGSTPPRSPSVRRPIVPGAPADGSLGKGERITLTAVAQYPDGVTREQLTILTGYTRSSRNTYLQRLGAAGFVTPAPGGLIVASDAGVAALGEFEPLPVGDGLRAYWLERLTGGERAVLEELAKQYPNAIDREALSESTGYTRSSRNTYLQRLGARKLIVIDRGAVRASEELFD